MRVCMRVRQRASEFPTVFGLLPGTWTGAWNKGLSHMSKSKPTLDMAALGTGVAIMTVVGLLDGLADQNAAGKAVRAGWKTTLGVAGLYLNISNFSSGQFQNDKFLYAYLGSMVAVGAATLYLSKKG